LKTGEPKKIEVKVKNFSNSSQTRNVSLFLNGVNVGIGQLVTLAPGQEMNVKFNVTATIAGTGTLTATLFPNDSNPSNDTLSVSVKIKEGNDKGKDKGKDK
jgi:subtilase family serine protease